jgi:4-hydroxybenzoate polyprenyltransferase
MESHMDRQSRDVLFVFSRAFGRFHRWIFAALMLFGYACAFGLGHWERNVCVSYVHLVIQFVGMSVSVSVPSLSC